MPGQMDPRKVTDFDRCIIREGMTTAAACRRVGVGLSWGYDRVAQLKDQGVIEQKIRIVEAQASGPIPFNSLNPSAKRAWNDFDYFRRRYMGHISTPWQIEAAKQVIAAVESDKREYVVMNCPPGGGKSVFTIDLAAYLTVRNRRLRGLFGSGTQDKSERMLRALRIHLERVVPVRSDPEAVRLGMAVDAESTLTADFGLFKPLDKGEPWRSDALLVVQPGFELTAEKEHTWMAYGLDTDYLGDRLDVMLWDDAVLPRDYQTVERMDMRHSNFDTITESRLEPTGALFLIGQRIHGTDLYRHCLDKADLPDDDETLDALEELSDEERAAATLDMGRMYQHIIYKAHYDEKCEGLHKRSDPPYPQGCLLSPRRLPWAELRRTRLNNPGHYATWYQQEDGDQSSALVKKVWVDGGTDPETGVSHWGCWDQTRDLCELPVGLKGPIFSFATVDPSPTRYWGVQWWCYAPNAEGSLFLMDIPTQRRMRADDFLEWRHVEGRFVGLAEEWQARSEQLGLPITHWIIEHNGAQRFLLQYEFVRRWTQQHGCSIIPHTTAVNKNDPKMGVWTLREPWRTSRVRLPRKSEAARLASLKLVDEVTRYPNGAADDQVMAMWFLVTRLTALAVQPDVENETQDRPSWVRDVDARHLVAV